jgi:hypothetical protein
MFRLFEIFADTVREQADDYAKAQARIGTRTLNLVMDPFGIASAVAGAAPVPAPIAGTELQPPRPKSERRTRRKAQATAKPRSRQSRRPALNFA